MVTGAYEPASATWRVIWPMVTGVAGDQADQAASGPVRCLGIEGQRRVEVELQEPHQAGAALRLPDQRADLLV